jgi:glycosyltransferase involved in cell wall biosynthesis/predicted metal-dependent phosphoesterase TrpH
MNPETTSARKDAAASARVDMHCHSNASALSRLGVQRAVGLPECATPPEELYALAKRRGMDFVTITDHDTISGVLEIADRPDVFISEELTAHFAGTDAAAHILCYGITAEDHHWLQAHRADIELCADYLHEREIACALAHPYYTVAAPLNAQQRRRLAERFDVWETRNGARASALNAPAADFIATHGGTGIGGSDDHGGVDIGRTWTQTPAAGSARELLAHVRAGRAHAGGSHGSAAKWAHSAVALAARVLRCGPADATYGRLDPRAVMTIAARLLREGEARHGQNEAGVRAQDARELLRSWLAAIELDRLDARALLALMQDERFSHADLHRRACRAHEQMLRLAVASATRIVGHSKAPAPRTGGEAPAAPPGSLAQAAEALFTSCVPVIPYAAANAFLANETARLGRHHLREERPRVAILVDGIGVGHGVTRVIQEIRSRGVPGFDVEVVGTDADVDRRLASVSELDLPEVSGLRIGVPSLPAALQTLIDGSFDLIHVCSPGPVGVAGVLGARGLGLPLIASHHTELVSYAALRTGRQELAEGMAALMRASYDVCELVLSPSSSADRALEALSVPLEKLIRWERGVDTSQFGPRLRTVGALPADSINVLYAGRLEREKGIELLADSFLRARREEPSLRLILAGTGAGEAYLRERVGDAATFLGWLDRAELARTYASADLFLFASCTDTFGQVVIEAQASGLPVVAVAAGGPAALVEDRVSGLLCAPEPQALANSVLELARSPLLRNRLAAAALLSARQRTWERTLERLALGYRRALDAAASRQHEVSSEPVGAHSERTSAPVPDAEHPAMERLVA